MSPFFLKILASAFVTLGISSCANDKAALNARALAFPHRASGNFLPASPSLSLMKVSAPLIRDKHGYPTYPETRRHRYVRTTAYSHMENEPGAPSNFNAIGTRLKYTSLTRSAAADWSLYPAGTKLIIKGLPYIYVIDDYGSALVGTNTIDIYHPSIRLMRKWGTRPAEIQVIQWGSWEDSARLLKSRHSYDHCRRMYANLMRKIRNGVLVQTGQTRRRAVRSALKWN